MFPSAFVCGYAGRFRGGFIIGFSIGIIRFLKGIGIRRVVSRVILPSLFVIIFLRVFKHHTLQNIFPPSGKRIFSTIYYKMSLPEIIFVSSITLCEVGILVLAIKMVIKSEDIRDTTGELKKKSNKN